LTILRNRLANTPSRFSLISSSFTRAESASLASGGAVRNWYFPTVPLYSPWTFNCPSHTLGRPGVLHGNSEMSAVLSEHPVTSPVLHVPPAVSLLILGLQAVLLAHPGPPAFLSVTNGTSSRDLQLSYLLILWLQAVLPALPGMSAFVSVSQ
jgi:hypothetical protein